MKAFTGPNVISRAVSDDAAAVSDDAAEDHRDDVPLAFWDRAGRRTIGRLALAPGATVLDVGCGIGATALPAAERVGPLGRVLGIELCEQLLGRASAQAVARGVGNIDWRSGDLTDLDLPDGRFDAVVCPFAIFFASDMAAQVRRLWRLVRPGGQLALTTWGPRAFEPALTGWCEAFRRVRPDLTIGFNPWLRFTHCRPWDRLADPGAVRRLLRDGGIPEAEVVAEEGRQPLRTPLDWWTIARGSALRWSIDGMGPEAAARVREANLKWLVDHGVEFVQTNVISAVMTRSRTAPEPRWNRPTIASRPTIRRPRLVPNPIEGPPAIGQQLRDPPGRRSRAASLASRRRIMEPQARSEP